MFLFCLVFAMSLCASVYMCFVVTCWERADLYALVCGVCCEFVTFPLVSWVRCGTWLYRFLIFAPLLTLNAANAIPSQGYWAGFLSKQHYTWWSFYSGSNAISPINPLFVIFSFEGWTKQQLQQETTPLFLNTNYLKFSLAQNIRESWDIYFFFSKVC